MYSNPSKNDRASEGTEANLRIIPVDDTEYKAQLVFPVIPQRDLSKLLDTAQRWLTDCQSSHLQCSESSKLGNNWYPTRLLDIGEPNSTCWRLHIVSEDGSPKPPAPYITLSYRWAQEPDLILLSSNIARFRGGSVISCLPVLFQDVISVAWYFSVRYIWIDALCIIQDSEIDWNTEAPSTHSVYANSMCNIAACHSENPLERLFSAGNTEMILPGLIESSLFSTYPRSCYIFDKEYFDRQINNGPLLNRGWVFQERFLAPRVLYFAKNQLLWECRTHHRCEVFPKGIPLHWSHKAMDVLLSAQPTEGALSMGRLSRNILQLWNNLIENYTRCDLTYPSDKLPAMAGIAKLFQKNSNDHYFAGLWGSHILAMMDWRAHDPRLRKTSDYRAPSWSWAAVDGPVKMRGLSRSDKFLVELVDIKVTTRFEDEMSTVLGGFITLKGRIIEATVQHSTRPEFVHLVTESDELKVQMFPDTLDADNEIVNNNRISYVPLKLSHIYDSRSMKNKIPYVFCLMLKQIDGNIDSNIQYRRIGHIQIHGQDNIDAFCLKAPMQSFTVF